MNPHDAVRDAQEKAEAARALLANKTLIAAFEAIEKQYLEEWQTTPAANATALQDIKYRQDALAAFRKNLETAVTGERIAEFNRGASRASTIGKNINRHV